MPRTQRFREIWTRPLDVEYLKQKSQEGWRLAAIEWERETDGGVPEAPGLLEEVPYGAAHSRRLPALGGEPRGNAGAQIHDGIAHPGRLPATHGRGAQPAAL